MPIFFKTDFDFWFSFVFLFLFCTGMGALLQCYFIIKFCNIKSRKRYYLYYLVISYATCALPFFLAMPTGQGFSTLLGVLVLFCFIKWILHQNYILATIVSALAIAVTVLVESLLAPLHEFALWNS